jgi:SAM-dependent methyltransferase
MLADPTHAVTVLRQLSRQVAAGAADDNQSQWTRIGLTCLNLPGRIVRGIKNAINRLMSRPRIPNLYGVRFIENSWIASHLPATPGEVLDFGSGDNYLALLAALRGFNVTAVDLVASWWPYIHPNIRFIRGDILKLPLSDDFFDVVINCSAIEHVGLEGRYGVTESCPNGDLEVMAYLWQILKPGGVMLLTIPVGQDAVLLPVHRVYGTQRLPQLLKDYTLEKQAFWVKDGQNRWILSQKETALSFKASGNSLNGLQNIYALGCFVLRKDVNEYG